MRPIQRSLVMGKSRVTPVKPNSRKVHCYINDDTRRFHVLGTAFKKFESRPHPTNGTMFQQFESSRRLLSWCRRSGKNRKFSLLEWARLSLGSFKGLEFRWRHPCHFSLRPRNQKCKCQSNPSSWATFRIGTSEILLKLASGQASNCCLSSTPQDISDERMMFKLWRQTRGK